MAVEFALISALFLVVLLVGIIELGRAFFYMNAAAQATRLGARMAVVCDKSGPKEPQQLLIKERMQQYLSLLQPDNIDIAYSPGGCTADGPLVCQFVTVQIIPKSTTFKTVIPFVPLTWTLPPFATTLPRESMSSSSDSGTNPVCVKPWTSL